MPLTRSQKRLRDEDSGDESLAGNADLSIKRLKQEQHSDDLELIIKPESSSKAWENNPPLLPSQLEVYRKHLSELSNGSPSTREHREEAYEAARKHNLGYNEVTFLNEARSSLDGGGLINPFGKVPREITSATLDETLCFAETKELRENDLDSRKDSVHHSEENSDNFEAEGEEHYSVGDDYEDRVSYGESEDDDESDNSEYNEHFELRWLEPIEIAVRVPSTADECGRPTNVAHCEAKLIRRDKMRHDFYAEMEQPSDETAKLAFDLFDRYGRFRSEYKSHPVIKGTGVWGQELDHGDILLIEQIFVKQPYRRQRFGQRMVEVILSLVQEKAYTYFVFVRPALLRLDDIEQEWDALQDDSARQKLGDREEDRAIMFYRSLGFRRVGSTTWFAMSWDTKHRSQRLTAAEDFDPPKTPPGMLHPLLRPFQQISDQSPSAFDLLLSREIPRDSDFLGVLGDCLKEKEPDDPCWKSTDQYGNTVLHLAAINFDTASVEWILSREFGNVLLQSRNHRGETPLESLEFKLEKLRTLRQCRKLIVHVSDKFKGHDDNAVRCMILLKRLGQVEAGHLQQLIGGCTCGQCLNGFLSPRMSHALLTHASLEHEKLTSNIDTSAGPDWFRSHRDDFNYLPLHVRDDLNTNASMRQCFVNLWDHVVTCLKRGEVPNERNVLNIAKDAQDWSSMTDDFLRKGATVEAVFLAICRTAMKMDQWMGDGKYEDLSVHVDPQLPECRNDAEFGYVSGSCGYRRISLVSHVNMMGETLDEDGNIVDSLM